MLPILPKTVHKSQGIGEHRHKKHPVISASTSNEEKTMRKTLKPVLPRLLLLLGVILVLTQVIPLAFSYYFGYVLSANGKAFLPIPQSFLERLTDVDYIEPGVDWFESVVAQSQPIEIDLAYKRKMTLNISHAGLTNINLATNVPGNNPSIYDEALKHGVAHLRGTSVPGDAGTSVIYGHSGVATFLTGKSSPQIVFSRLDTVSIGDTMSIERDGKELRYVVSGKKIIEPQDLSFMSEQKGKERAVLLTCWPLGIGTKRLIIIADRI
jgi:LPXTG-site transpeptidase (sortase) family protein